MSSPTFIDTHCHIHEAQYKFAVQDEFTAAREANVEAMILVGTSVESSREAVSWAQKLGEGAYVALGVHPHEAEDFLSHATFADIESLVNEPKVVAIGEIGLDYFYEHSQRAKQERILRGQLEIAQTHDLPIIFHVRGSKKDPDDVFTDLWRILSDYPGITRGVMHSFTASSAALTQVLERGFLIGMNGIMTFSADKDHNDMARTIPLSSIILETDAPYLTPKPIRGTINTPKNVSLVAEFLASHRGETIETIASITTKNAKNLFTI